ncbi:hypothetical protein BC829DRAFT_433952 [Chytridium lagenaria]|nr:hypothetical protein BC829DRAFT_433952 [Chytridium lagenaria]
MFSLASTWSLPMKTTLCVHQTAFCSNICASPTLNTCLPTSLTWSCACSNGLRVASSSFPIQCKGELVECQSKCGGKVGCGDACIQHFACGTETSKEVVKYGAFVNDVIVKARQPVPGLPQCQSDLVACQGICAQPGVDGVYVGICQNNCMAAYLSCIKTTTP